MNLTSIKKTTLIFLSFILCTGAYTQITIELLKDIHTEDDSNPSEFIVYEGHLYFNARNSENGTELWKTDGTEEGTIMVKDIKEGISSSDPSKIVVAKGKLIFIAKNDEFGRELWVSDGSEEGTTIIKDINLGEGNTSFSEMYTHNDVAYLGAGYLGGGEGAIGEELWTSEGTEVSTNLLKEIYPGILGSEPGDFFSFNDKLIFSARDIDHGIEFWITDGTVANTVMLKDIWPGTNNGRAFDGLSMMMHNDLVYFSAKNDEYGKEIWVTDGTEEGTQLLKDIFPGDASSQPFMLGSFGDKFYFSAVHPDYGREIWTTDGTEEGTVLFTEIAFGEGIYSSSNPSQPIIFQDKMYFSADNKEGDMFNRDLWVSDGTPEGTQMLIEINPDGSSNPGSFNHYAGKLYFVAEDGEEMGTQLWVSDGTAEGTEKIIVDTESVHPLYSSKFIEFNGSLYFTASYFDHGVEVWKLTDPDFISTFSEVEKKAIRLYPNPISNELFFEVGETVHTIEIFDLTGQVVFSDYKMQTNSITKLDLEQLNSGIYLLTLTTSNGSLTRKFIKK